MADQKTRLDGLLGKTLWESILHYVHACTYAWIIYISHWLKLEQFEMGPIYSIWPSSVPGIQHGQTWVLVGKGNLFANHFQALHRIIHLDLIKSETSNNIKTVAYGGPNIGRENCFNTAYDQDINHLPKKNVQRSAAGASSHTSQEQCDSNNEFCEFQNWNSFVNRAGVVLYHNTYGLLYTHKLSIKSDLRNVLWII